MGVGWCSHYSCIPVGFQCIFDFLWINRLALGLLVVGAWIGHPGLVFATIQEDQSGQAASQPAGGGLSDAGQLSEAELDNLTAEVADELRCIVCRNQSVLESNSELAREMQQLIRDRLAAGESPEQARSYFVSRYGDYILLKPRASGVSVLVYVLPVLAFLLGGLVLVLRLRKWSEADGAGSTAPGKADGGTTSTDGFGVPAAEPAVGTEPAVPIGKADSALSETDEAWLQKALSEE